MGNYLSISRYRFSEVLGTILVNLCIERRQPHALRRLWALWKTLSTGCFFSQVGGFLLANGNLVEKLSHIRGIQHGQIQMARIVLIQAGDGDLGRMIENRPLGAVFEFLQRKGPEVGCRATS